MDQDDPFGRTPEQAAYEQMLGEVWKAKLRRDRRRQLLAVITGMLAVPPVLLLVYAIAKGYMW